MSEPADPARSKRILCLAAVWLIWGSSYLATRIGVTHLPPLLFAGIRFTVSGLLLAAFALGRGFDPRALRTEWRHVVVLGVVGVALVNGLQVWAMQWVPSSTGALLNASCAFWIVLFGLFGRRAHRPSVLAWSGIAVGFAGTVALVLPGSASVAGAFGPQLLILVGCLMWSVATIYLRNCDTRLDVFALTAFQMLCGGLLMLVLGLATGEAAHLTWSPAGFAAMAWQTVMSSCLAYTAYTWLAKNASPAQTGTFGYVNPLIAAVLGYLILDERMTGLQVAAAGVVIVGVVLVNWPTSATMRRLPKAI